MPGRRDRVPLGRRRGSDRVAYLGPGVPSRRGRAPVRRRSGSRAGAPRTEDRAARALALAAAALLVLGACGSGGGTSAPPTGGTTPSTASLVEERSAAGRPETTLATRWARTLSGPSNEDEIDGIAAAPDGGVYLTGKFERSTTVGTTTLESAGAADIPVARVEADGTVAWVARYGGAGEDNFFDIAADDRGAVASGIFTGTVAFGSSTLTSAGGADCAVVAFARDGSVRWATSLGGPGADGCNEISIAPDGSVITSLDTDGGWTSPAGAIPEMRWSDTLLLRLDPDGAVVWGRRVGGDGPQRGKSLAVGPDGSIAFGGDSVGALVADGTSVGAAGGRRDGWITEWSADGRLRWSAAWGGPGDDLVKGLAYEGSGIFAVGTFGGVIDIGGTRLDAGAEDDLFVTKVQPDGVVDWVASVRAEQALTGAEVTGADDGGVIFASAAAAGLQVVGASGEVTPLRDPDAGTAWLTHYRPDGSVALASTIAGTAGGNPDEIGRTGNRIYLDVKVRGAGNVAAGAPVDGVGKDGSVWALDIVRVG